MLKECVSVKHFSTYRQREGIIREFLLTTRHIDRHKLYWVISIDESSPMPIQPGPKTNRKPVTFHPEF
jgi:hypothetical protein